MEFLAKFKSSPILSLILGLGCLAMDLIEWRSGLVIYHGEHHRGNWDFTFLLVLFGACGLWLTVSGIWGLCRPMSGDA